MTAYVVARLRNVRFGPDIEAYLQAVDATFAPFGGRFLIHGGAKEVREGGAAEDTVVVAFPDMDRARAWYESEAYQAILPLRTRNSEADLVLLEGVEPGHRATDILAGR